MLVTLKKILNIAEERKIAIGAFNAPNLESLQAVMAAADEMDLPVIIQFAPVHEMHNLMSLMGPLMVDYAKKARVPVCAHLDHGDSIERVRQALDLGFTSVMYDGSVLPYEENVANTKKIVEETHARGASVEAELGSMGKTETGEGVGSGEDDETKIYTDPVQAKDFVARTGIDALACSFGTTHGIYLKKPRLDFSVVANVRRETGGIPVVMHGGSGVSVDDFHAAVQAGVRKINYFTYMDRAAGLAVKQWAAGLKETDQPFYTSVTKVAREAMKEDVKAAMRTFACLD
ncbi:MAG: class II fructose-bisphosphate aldolase [Clostridiales bacterium]|nr:class II fructose-bisphosphate aldolase [Clostridiales bacterium]